MFTEGAAVSSELVSLRIFQCSEQPLQFQMWANSEKFTFTGKTHLPSAGWKGWGVCYGIHCWDRWKISQNQSSLSSQVSKSNATCSLPSCGDGSSYTAAPDSLTQLLLLLSMFHFSAKSQSGLCDKSSGIIKQWQFSELTGKSEGIDRAQLIPWKEFVCSFQYITISTKPEGIHRNLVCTILNYKLLYEQLCFRKGFQKDIEVFNVCVL